MLCCVLFANDFSVIVEIQHSNFRPIIDSPQWGFNAPQTGDPAISTPPHERRKKKKKKKRTKSPSESNASSLFVHAQDARTFQYICVLRKRGTLDGWVVHGAWSIGNAAGRLPSEVARLKASFCGAFSVPIYNAPLSIHTYSTASSTVANRRKTSPIASRIGLPCEKPKPRRRNCVDQSIHEMDGSWIPYVLAILLGLLILMFSTIGCGSGSVAVGSSSPAVIRDVHARNSKRRNCANHGRELDSVRIGNCVGFTYFNVFDNRMWQWQ